MTKNIKTRIKKYINIFLINFTLAKFTGALFTILIVAIIKYIISGNLHIEYSEFWNNVGIGLFGWTINTAIIGWLSEYFGIYGINISLEQLLYGKNIIGVPNDYSSDFKPKLYHAMDSTNESNNDKDMDIERNIDRGYNESTMEDVMESGNESLDKGKGIDRTVHSTPAKAGEPVNPHMVTWSKVFPGVDPASIFFPKTINPGPGFNVPGGEVPIRDEICKHIDYNSHILNQFKTMDLKTAIEQRDNYLKYLEVISHKTTYAQETLLKVPEIPTNEFQYNLRIKILSDLEDLKKQKVRAEAKSLLLNSRIEFINIHKKSDE